MGAKAEGAKRPGFTAPRIFLKFADRLNLAMGPAGLDSKSATAASLAIETVAYRNPDRLTDTGNRQLPTQT